MMDNKPLLSLCIPTYNRSVYLKNCIDSIICQREFQEGKVEIVISDNASEDNTKEIVLEYTKKFSNINYHRNNKNVRDENFPIVLSLGRGVLRRLCNDTLVFRAGALQEMINIITQYEEERPYLFWLNGNKDIINEMGKTEFRDFVLNASYWMTSIACFSIWDSECLNIADDKAGAELSLWQVRKGLELAYKKDAIVIHNKKIINLQNVSKKNVSYGLYKVFYTNYFDLLEPYFLNAKLKNEDREKLERELLFEFFLKWCVRWELSAQGDSYSKEENLKDAIEKQYQGKSYWLEYKRKYQWIKYKETTKKVLIKIKHVLERLGLRFNE